MSNLRETTLVHLVREGEYLMLHRIKKNKDVNAGKWIGVGGHLEAGETPEECAIRETFEETGLTVHSLDFRGIVDFYNDGDYDDERIYIYTSGDFSGELKECNEGVLAWIPGEEVLSLNLWEGDPVFLKPLLAGVSDFYFELHYEGDRLAKVVDHGTLPENMKKA